MSRVIPPQFSLLLPQKGASSRSGPALTLCGVTLDGQSWIAVARWGWGAPAWHRDLFLLLFPFFSSLIHDLSELCSKQPKGAAIKFDKIVLWIIFRGQQRVLLVLLLGRMGPLTPPAQNPDPKHRIISCWGVSLAPCSRNSVLLQLALKFNVFSRGLN